MLLKLSLLALFDDGASLSRLRTEVEVRVTRVFLEWEGVYSAP
jgi:hypothetical protein